MKHKRLLLGNGFRCPGRGYSFVWDHQGKISQRRFCANSGLEMWELLTFKSKKEC